MKIKMKTIMWHLCNLLLIKEIACSHFRGGMMSLKYNDKLNQMEIPFQTFWRSGNDFCSGSSVSISCLNGCNYVSENCTNRDFSTSQDWVSGEKTFVYRNEQFDGEFSGCCWVNDVGAGSWGLKIRSNFNNNSSPITTMLPIIRLQYGCGITIKIPVDDSDGNVVRCRWAKAEQRECGGYCQTISGSINNCTLDIGSTGIGKYGIAIQIEDFESLTSNVPLSSIPLQFILDVYNSTSPCSDLPRIIGTLPDDSYVPVLPDSTWRYNITAQSSIGSNIIEIITVSPKGMTKSSILNGNSFQEWYTTLNWRPDYSQYGVNILCYAAVDNLGRMSAKNCLFLVVGVIDTVIGDPLYAVPLLLNVSNALDGPALCYEVHGAANTTFNIVSDTYTSVNAYYSLAISGSDHVPINIITKIGILAIDSSGACQRILVVLDGCTVFVNGAQITSYQQANIGVRQIGDRVRVSVPNGGSPNLVLWVVCEQRLDVKMIRFVISRGQNLRPTSHGIIGQFWNIPISMVLYSGALPAGYDSTEPLYIVTVSPPSGPQRSFLGEQYGRSWDNTKKTCYYSGDAQGGSTGVAKPDDSVMQGTYTDYVTGDIFSPVFHYNQFKGCPAPMVAS